MTKNEAMRVIGILVATYPSPEWPSETVKVYAQFLEDLDFAQTMGTVEKWIQTERQRPAISDIRRAVATAGSGGHLPPEEAWGFVQQCFSRVGQYRPFPDTYPLVKRVVDLFRWEALCQSTEVVADRARFLEAYRNQLDTEVRRCAALPGATGKEAKHLPQNGSGAVEGSLLKSLTEMVGSGPQKRSERV